MYVQIYIYIYIYICVYLSLYIYFTSHVCTFQSDRAFEDVDELLNLLEAIVGELELSVEVFIVVEREVVGRKSSLI